MYRVVILFVFVFAASGVPEDVWLKCRRLHNALSYCCTGITTHEMYQRDDFKECFENKKPPPPGSCELQNCIGKVYGYYGDNGFDKAAFVSFVEKTTENNEELVAALKEKCVNVDISKYGPPDMCDISKMERCYDNQYLKTCPKWSNEYQCKGFQDLIPECIFDV